MKKIYLSVIFISLSVAAISANITAISNGSWKSGNTWNLGRKPQAGDNVIIPASRTVTLTGAEFILSGPVEIMIHGELNLNFGQLYLHENSSVTVSQLGEIVSVASFFDLIQIGDVIKLWGLFTPSLEGPMIANSTSGNGFVFIPLPMKFSDFSVARTNTGARLEWTTIEEVNASHYEIQRSTNGLDWETIANVPAAGNSTTSINYSYMDFDASKGNSQYRIRQVDLDGMFAYTTVRTLKSINDNSAVTIFSTPGKSVNLQFNETVRTSVVVRVTSVNGQVLVQQRLSQPNGLVQIPVKAGSIGIVTVLYDNGQLVSRQVML